uniref:Uncharacterized protein n=1 Tax=Timema douglasi TaxID=61478 RepID=A0A7R8VTX5_TIMDO|nr:unnamed protein product [Timema douglasi]
MKRRTQFTLYTAANGQRGQFSKSVSCLELCLPAVEEQFGPNSIELANELQKVTDVMICELQQIPPHSHRFITNYSRACVCLQRAKDIMELCYGMWNKGLQDIIRKQHQLEQLFQQK